MSFCDSIKWTKVLPKKKVDKEQMKERNEERGLLAATMKIIWKHSPSIYPSLRLGRSHEKKKSRYCFIGGGGESPVQILNNIWVECRFVTVGPGIKS